MSQPTLPRPVFGRIGRFAVEVEETLEAEGHAVETAQSAHPGFRRNWVGSDLIRAIISAVAQSLGDDDLVVEDLGRGGVEAVIVHEGIERRFRLKLAKPDPFGKPVVKVNSDSIMTMKVRDPSLFDDLDFGEDEDRDEQDG